MNPPDITAAVCRELPPGLFDVTSPIDTRPGLETCATCTVKVECLRAVDPWRSYYDGIAGGYVWQDGRVREWSVKENDTIAAYYATIPSRPALPDIVDPNQETIEWP